MRPGIRRFGGLAYAFLAAALLSSLSRIPWDASGADRPMILGSDAMAPRSTELALIRLSWRVPGDRIDECRRSSPEELDALPIHMRREEVCEGRILPYRLRVALDEQIVIDEMVHPAGAREDRPLYVFRELFVPPGAYVIEVVWEPERSPKAAAQQDAEAIAKMDTSRLVNLELLPSGVSADESVRLATGSGFPGVSSGLSLTTEIRLAPNEVTLITYDSDARVLVARGRGVPSMSNRL